MSVVMVEVALLRVAALAHALLWRPAEPACKEVSFTTLHPLLSTLQPLHLLHLTLYSPPSSL